MERDGIFSIPEIDEHDIEGILDQFHFIFQVEPLVLQTELSTLESHQSIGLVIPKKYLLSEVTIAGNNYQLAWVHPRRVQVAIKDSRIRELYDMAVDWLIDQDFAAGFLANNLQKFNK